MSNETKRETKVEYLGCTQEQATKINSMVAQVEKIKETHETNIKQFEYVVEQIDNEKWFLEHATKKLKHGQEKYTNLRATLLKRNEANHESYTAQLNGEKKSLEKVVAVLEKFNKHVDVETVETPTLNTVKLSYDYDFFVPYLELGTVIGWLELE